MKPPKQQPEKIAGRPRVEIWVVRGRGLGFGRTRAVHDNLGFTFYCSDRQRKRGDVILCGNAVRSGVATLHAEGNGVLHGRILRAIDNSEVQSLLAQYTGKKYPLESGHWYEIMAD